MPIPDEMGEKVRGNSKIADLAQHNTERWGGASYAAAFLREFVDEVPWAHLDIAGPAYNEKAAYGHVTAGRHRGRRSPTLVELARDLADGADVDRPGLRRSGVAGALLAGAGCRPASGRGSRPRPRRTTGCRCCWRTGAPTATDGTRRRVHSPSWATSSSVTSLTAVRGSTNPSTPRRVRANSVRCAWSAVSERPHGREAAVGVASAARRLRPRSRSSIPMATSVTY